MKKYIIIFLVLFVALTLVGAAGKFKVKDNFSIEWKDDTTPANRDNKDDEQVLDWGGIDNYFQWDSEADIYKGDKLYINFSFWNGWDTWYNLNPNEKDDPTKNLSLDIETEFNNSLNFKFGEFYTFTLGFRPVGKVRLFSPAASSAFEFQHGYFDTSLENIIKIPKIMDFNVKAYYRYKMGREKTSRIEDWPNTYNNRVTGNIAILTAVGSPGIWTGDVFRAYHIWDPTGAWQMGFKNNCGVWPMYSWGFGWMFNSIVQMDLDYRYARDWNTGENGEFYPEQYSVLQKIHVKMYLGLIQNLSKIAGIKGFDIIVKAEQAVDMEMPYATGTEMTKSINTLGYYGIQLGWNGLSWDLMATFCTRDTWDKSRPLQKDQPDAPGSWYASAKRADWQNPAAMLGFATKLQFTAGHFTVFGQYIGYAEIRKSDAVWNTKSGDYESIRDEKWTNYIKLGLGFSGF
ncbi:MAG: hypothetical protein JXB50_16640 [Spirochaetes bacterium]|nr:hypothetical protein [Spirochaetota bacterium]